MEHTKNDILYGVKLLLNQSQHCIKIQYVEKTTLISQSNQIITKAKTLLTICKKDKLILENDDLLFIADKDFNALKMFKPELIEDQK